MRRHGVAASGVISLVGSAINAVLGFALIALVGRGVGTAETGLFFQLVGWFMIAVALARCGADTGLLRALAQQSIDHRVAEVRQSVLVALVPVGIVAVGIAVAGHLAAYQLAPLLELPDTGAGAGMVRTLSWSLAPAVLLAVMLGGLRGLGDVVAFTVIQSVVLPVARILLVGAVLAWGAGHLSALLAAWVVPLPLLTVVTAVVLARGIRSLARQHHDVGRAPSTGEAARRFWSFSAARGAAAVLEALLEWLDVLVVAALRSPAEAGIYAVATRIVRVGYMVDTAIRIAVSPPLATHLGRGESEAASTLFSAMGRVVVLTAWPLFLLLGVFTETVLDVFGEGFRDGATTLRILTVAMMLTLVASMVQSILLMGGRAHYQLGNKAVAVVVNLSLNLLLVPVLGIVGAAVSWSATMAVDTLLAAVQVRGMHVSLDVRTLGLPVLLALAVLGEILLVRLVLGDGLMSLAVAALAAGAIHLAALWRLRLRLGLDRLLTL